MSMYCYDRSCIVNMRIMGYTIYMSPKHSNTQYLDSKRAVNKKSGTLKPFIITLLATLAIGTVVIVVSVLKDSGDTLESVNTAEDKDAIVAPKVYEIDGSDSALQEGTEDAGDDDGGEPVGRYAALLADEELCREQRIYGKDAMYADEISLLFAGDVSFAEGYDNISSLRLRGGEIDAAFNDAALKAMQEADVFMVNNEFTYSTRGTPTEDKQYTLRAKPETVRYLTDMGVDIVSLANNHTYDYGEISLLDTIDTLESEGIPYVGAGRDIEEAVKPVYFIVNDIKIGVVSATQIEKLDNPDTKGATETSAGVFRCWNSSRVFDVIAQTKADSDYCVVYVHWGTELMENTDWAQDELAPKLAAAGADLIIGDHPHILQKIDYIGDTPVIYSLGNYWFNGKTRDTGLLEVTLDLEGNTNTVRFIPALQSGSVTSVLDGVEKLRILDYMQSISPHVVIDTEGYVRRR